ncbi:MAG TPA: AAA family ATPase [Tepidisphaeraceae bacterium]
MHHDLPAILVTRQLDAGIYVGEVLLFPEVVALHGDPQRLHDKLKALARQVFTAGSPAEVYRRLAGATPEVSRVLVPLEPPKKSPAWSHPIMLQFDVLRWRHGEEASVAYVPALGIELAAARDEQLDELIPRHIRTALARTKASQRLFDLAQLDRVESTTVDREAVTPDIPTPAQVGAADRSKRQEKTKPVIEQAGMVLTDAAVTPAYEIDGLVDRLADALAGRHPKSVLLVGPSGVGKTAAFHELFRQRRRYRLANAPFWTTSGARLIAGMSGYGLWQQRCQSLCRQAKSAGAILNVGNVVELMEVGKAGGSQFGIASFFRPYLARADVLAVAECTPEQLPLIERDNPHLLAVFQQIRVEEPGPDACKMILFNAALNFAAEQGSASRAIEHLDAQTQDHPANDDEEDEEESQPSPPATPPAATLPPSARTTSPMTEDALDTLDRLHRRYATYSAAPGRPLRFLKNLLQDRAAAAATWNPALGTRNSISSSDVTSAFSRETGLPVVLLDDATPIDLDAAHAYFAARVIGQHGAVDLVTDLLATVKAALNRPRRPIASLLFIGPTGVGKTEMAKALSDFVFGAGSGENTKMEDGKWRMATDQSPSSILHPPSSCSSNLVRFDMSEFATPAAISRLIGNAWESHGLLTSKVREQPFCVLLFDEFEKADPAFFDLLLQVLGEGRLTDSAGRLADFSNAIVVMTSNLGAAEFQSGPFGLSRVTADGASRARSHFTDAVRDFLRPELFSRIDRVVPFLPLDRPTIERIAAREIDLIRRRDGVSRRDLVLDVNPAAIAYLAKAGYDPLYGARPLKRRLEQDLLAPLSDAANQYAAATALIARVDMRDGTLSVEVRAATAEQKTKMEDGGWKMDKGDGSRDLPPSSILHPPSSLPPLARRASALRRRVQAIARSPASLALGNELFTLNRLLTRRLAHPGRRFVDPAHRERAKRLRAISDGLASLTKDVTALEDALLLSVYEAAPLPAAAPEIETRLARLDADAADLLLHLFTLEHPDPHAVTLALFGAATADLFALARGYVELARSNAQRPPSSILHPPSSSCAVSYYTRHGKTALQRTLLDADEVDAFLANPRGGILGIVLAIRAPFARARLETETGLHVIQETPDKNPHPIWADASPKAPADYAPPENVEFRVALAGQRRRTYTLDRQEAADPPTRQTYRWTSRTLADPIAAATTEHLRRRAEGIINEEEDET